MRTPLAVTPRPVLKKKSRRRVRVLRVLCKPYRSWAVVLLATILAFLLAAGANRYQVSYIDLQTMAMEVTTYWRLYGRNLRQKTDIHQTVLSDALSRRGIHTGLDGKRIYSACLVSIWRDAGGHRKRGERIFKVARSLELAEFVENHGESSTPLLRRIILDADREDWEIADINRVLSADPNS